MARHKIVVLLSGGEKLQSPVYEDQAAAEAELATLREEMKVPGATNVPWLAVMNARNDIKAAWIAPATMGE